MKSFLSILTVVLLSCNSIKQEIPHPAPPDAIDYLKKEFRVDPQPHRFDTFFKEKLISDGISFEIDSLISYRLKRHSYKPLNLDLITYHNRFFYKDIQEGDCYMIYFMKDNATGKFYKDMINENGCMIIEDYCMWSWIRRLETDKKNSISPADIAVYNGIESKRRFSSNEFRSTKRNTGFESYLNDVYRFNKPGHQMLDSFFKFYDTNFITNRDTLLEMPEGLFKFLTRQVNEIKTVGYYNPEENSLQYLKDEISLLLLKQQDSGKDSYLRVYSAGRRLRVREVVISGNSRSGYSYVVDEKYLCF